MSNLNINDKLTKTLGIVSTSGEANKGSFMTPIPFFSFRVNDEASLYAKEAASFLGIAERHIQKKFEQGIRFLYAEIRDAGEASQMVGGIAWDRAVRHKYAADSFSWKAPFECP
ncbi:hypothetical protein L0F63_004490 [Massospora cicadina]|nr:hypothetical protein L0F63_004490 [Massospora cicadina]